MIDCYIFKVFFSCDEENILKNVAIYHCWQWTGYYGKNKLVFEEIDLAVNRSLLCGKLQKKYRHGTS